MTDTEIETTILRVVADVKAQSPSTLVREAKLRLACDITSSDMEAQFRRVLESMVPRELIRSTPHDPCYEFTAEGWLRSPRRPAVDRVVSAVVAAYVAASPSADGRVIIDAELLSAQHLTDDDVGLTLTIVRAFYLATEAHGVKRLGDLRLVAPPDVEELRKLSTAEAVYEYRRRYSKDFVDFRERLRNSFDAVTRQLIDDVWAAFGAERVWPRLSRLEVAHLDQRPAFHAAIRSPFFHGGGSTGPGVRLSLSLAGLIHAPRSEELQEAVLETALALSKLYEENPEDRSVDMRDLIGSVGVSEKQLRGVVEFLVGNSEIQVDHNEYRTVFPLSPRSLAARGCLSVEELAFRFAEQTERDAQGQRFSARRSVSPFPAFGLPWGIGDEQVEHEPGDGESLSQKVIASQDVSELGPRPRVVGFLGSGAEADVYVVMDRFGRRVAAKIFYESKRVPEHIYGHAVGLARVPHPAVATLYTIDEVDLNGAAVPAILMELLEGEELEKRLQREVTKYDVKDWGRTLLDVIAAMHSVDHFHADMHPGNFFVTERGLRIYDVLRSPSADHRSSATKQALRSADLRRAREILLAMLERLPVSEVVQDAARDFSRRTWRQDVTLEAISEAFSEALDKIFTAIARGE
jgi:hypothetical protein